MPLDIKLSEFPKVPLASQLDSNKKISTEVRKFSPSSIVSLYEIDVEGLLIDKQAPYDVERRTDAVFRFHNNLKLLKQDIIWRGQTYRALPIKMDGYESSTRGALPTPKMTLLSNDAFNPDFTDFRSQLRKLDDLIGAKVTRIRTFTKYLDEANFFVKVGGAKTPIGNIDHIIPEDFEPDPLAEFPREIYFIERKSAENRAGIEFELSSAIDFEEIKLPRRIVVSSFCNFTYRGEGCLYEYSSHFASASDAGTRKKAEKGFGSDNIKDLNFPTKAPPIATVNDELIQNILGEDYRVIQDPARWENYLDNNKGDVVFLEKDSIKYYFVAKVPVTNSISQPGSGPPNKTYWLADQCSKSINGCKLRWSNAHKQSLGLQTVGEFSVVATRGGGDTGDGNTHKGALPFGGFPATNKIS